ncbi:hypothetical protein E2C01_092126 [Portunus trituberculatus]|uniref:Uncharacterized protein n=1 Tax=Portunus trituberculatus TaxID=210409 RepID=A0A5B7JUM8_PORTR|nr:hypothetical protein [Portunus trituberculatus]
MITASFSATSSLSGCVMVMSCESQRQYVKTTSIKAREITINIFTFEMPFYFHLSIVG